MSMSAFDFMVLDPSAYPDSWRQPDEVDVRVLLDEVQYLQAQATDEAEEALLLTIEQVAKRLQVGRCTAQALLLDGSIRSFKIGRLRRVPPEAVQEYIDRSASDCQG